MQTNPIYRDRGFSVGSGDFFSFLFLFARNGNSSSGIDVEQGGGGRRIHTVLTRDAGDEAVGFFSLAVGFFTATTG